MSDPITPSFVENLTTAQFAARIKQMGAAKVQQHSTQSRAVYWSKGMGTWILVTSAGGNLRVAYFQMEDCPCNKGK